MREKIEGFENIEYEIKGGQVYVYVGLPCGEVATIVEKSHIRPDKIGRVDKRQAEEVAKNLAKLFISKNDI